MRIYTHVRFIFSYKKKKKNKNPSQNGFLFVDYSGKCKALQNSSNEWHTCISDGKRASHVRCSGRKRCRSSFLNSTSTHS